MNKNSKLLMMMRAKKITERIKKNNPDLSNEQITEKVVKELYGKQGVAILDDVKKNPEKYKQFTQGFK